MNRAFLLAATEAILADRHNGGIPATRTELIQAIRKAGCWALDTQACFEDFLTWLLDEGILCQMGTNAQGEALFDI